MATDQDFVEYVVAQSGLGAQLTYKKMFGEYALYLYGKVVAFACDNQLFLKPTPEGKAVLGTVSEHPAYPGSKMYYRLDGELDNGELLRRALETTADAVPLPKPRPKPKPKPKSAAKPTPKAAAPKAPAKKSASRK